MILDALYDARTVASVQSIEYAWSSTENNSYNAWGLCFGDGNWYNYSKSYSRWVVPFRRGEKTVQREQVKELVLANGFKLKTQPHGSEDLNPYVYEFAEALMAPLQAEVERLREVVASDTHLVSIKRLFEAEQERDQLKAALQRFMELDPHDRDLPDELRSVQHDTPHTEVVKGIYSVVNLKVAIGLLDHIHCNLDSHTVDKGYPVERTPVLVGGKESPLEDLPYPVLLMGVRDRKTAKVVLYAAPLQASVSEVPLRKVVCAACRNGDYMLVGPRHFCPTMHVQAEAYLKLGYVDDRKWEQGFIDQWETYMDRHEALLVALAAGQPVDFKRNGGSGNELYSEGLY
jgi:hypothetical protein